MTRAPPARRCKNDREIGEDVAVEIERVGGEGTTPGLVRETYIAGDGPPQQHRAVVATTDGDVDTAVDRCEPVIEHKADLVRSVLADG